MNINLDMTLLFDLQTSILLNTLLLMKSSLLVIIIHIIMISLIQYSINQYYQKESVLPELYVESQIIAIII